jgi:hypothetical protein
MNAGATSVRHLIVLLMLAMSAPAWAQPQGQPASSSSVDANGHLLFDPSRNVLDLVRAAIERQDDLRRVVEELLKAKLEAVSRESEMRSAQDRELLAAVTLRLDREALLRAEFAKEIAATEKARVDAIRQVDKTAVDQTASAALQTAANLAKTQTDSAAVLSTQVSTSAEALRNLVATTAAESNRNIQQQFTTLGTRVAALEQGSATLGGERKYSDPAVAAIAEQVRVLVRQQADSSGISTGSSSTWGIIIAVGTLAILLIGVIVAIVSLNRKVAANGVPQGG